MKPNDDLFNIFAEIKVSTSKRTDILNWILFLDHLVGIILMMIEKGHKSLYNRYLNFISHRGEIDRSNFCKIYRLKNKELSIFLN